MQSALPLVRIRLSGQPTACSPQTAPLPKKRAARPQAAAAVSSPAAPEVSVRLDLEDGRVRVQLRVGGRAALFGAGSSNGAPKLRRASALAASASRALSEQELELALAAAEAGEVERGRSQELERQLAVERAEKEALRGLRLCVCIPVPKSVKVRERWTVALTTVRVRPAPGPAECRAHAGRYTFR